MRLRPASIPDSLLLRSTQGDFFMPRRATYWLLQRATPEVFEVGSREEVSDFMLPAPDQFVAVGFRCSILDSTPLDDGAMLEMRVLVGAALNPVATLYCLTRGTFTAPVVPELLNSGERVRVAMRLLPSDARPVRAVASALGYVQQAVR
jgi:hypothetical protein